MKPFVALILPIVALAVAPNGSLALAASVNIHVTYSGPAGTNASGMSIDQPINLAPGVHRTSTVQDPKTGKLIPVFQVGTGENLRMLSVDELKTAAESGDTACQKELSYVYETGAQGVGVDSVQAYKWASLAESADAEKTQRTLRRLELFMKPEELAQAKKAVEGFRAEAAKKKEAAGEKPKTGPKQDRP